MEGLKLGGAFGDAIAVLQLMEELVCEGDSFGGLGCCKGLAYGVGDVAGEDVGGVFVVYVSEDWLKF